MFYRTNSLLEINITVSGKMWNKKILDSVVTQTLSVPLVQHQHQAPYSPLCVPFLIRLKLKCRVLEILQYNGLSLPV